MHLSRILAVMRIYPKDVKTDFKELKQEIEKALPSEVFVHKFEEEPIAFGLTALIAFILIPEEKSGMMELVEVAVRRVPGVSEIEVLRVTRI